MSHSFDDPQARIKAQAYRETLRSANDRIGMSLGLGGLNRTVVAEQLSGGSECPRRCGEITEQLDIIAKQREEFKAVMQGLVDRIRPVLATRPAANEALGKADGPCTTEVGIRLQDISTDIRSWTYAIRGLTDLIEL